MNTFNTTRALPQWLAIVAAFICVGVSTQDSAVAAEPREGVRVSYADLDLSSSAGAATLYRRIKLAAHKVCGLAPGRIEWQRYEVWKNCYHAAIANAVVKVASPQLTALHGKSRNGERLTASLVRDPRGS